MGKKAKEKIETIVDAINAIQEKASTKGDPVACGQMVKIMEAIAQKSMVRFFSGEVAMTPEYKIECVIAAGHHYEVEVWLEAK